MDTNTFKNAGLLVLLLLLMCSKTEAQSFIGTVKDANNGEAIPFAHVIVDRYSTVTDQTGKFTLNLAPGIYTLQIQFLGYKEYQVELDTKAIQSKTFELQRQSLKLKSVDVSGHFRNPLSSAITISDQAIDYQQATNLADVLALLPGGTHEQKKDLAEAIHAGLETSIIIDGQVVQNMATMQHDKLPANTGEYDAGQALSHTGAGIDYRSISTDDIASIEIINGVSSAEYGDHTGKIIRITTKKGGNQTIARLKSNGYTRLASVSKGFQLKIPGSLRFSLDYLNSASDRRSPYYTFDRITSRLGYNNCFMRTTTPLHFNFNVAYAQNVDDNKHDPDAMLPDERWYLKERNWSFNTMGHWQLNKALIHRIDYQASASMAHEESYTRKYLQPQSPAFSHYNESGLNQGQLYPAEYVAEKYIDGAPRYYQAKLKATQIRSFGRIRHRFILGGEYNYSANKGDGHRTYPFPADEINQRKPDFSALPARESIVWYSEEQLKLPLGKQSLNISAGIRATNYQAKSFTKSNLGWRFEPRLKAGIELINNKDESLHFLNIRSGIGRFYQAPPLAYLHQSPKYKDYISLLIQDDNGDNTGVWLTTIKVDDPNTINASYSIKKELGLDIKWHDMAGHFTLYFNKKEKQFNQQKTAQWVEYNQYDASALADNTAPDFESLPYTTEKEIMSSTFINNNGHGKQVKFDYQLVLGKIKALSSELILDGSWSQNTAYYYNSINVPAINSSSQVKGIAIYNDAPAQKTKNTYSTSRLQLVTHLPELRLLINSSLQYTQTSRSLSYTFQQQPVMIQTSDEDLVFTNEMSEQPEYDHFIIEGRFDKQSEPDVITANIKMTKEIGSHLKCSVFINNLMNHRPFYKRSDHYTYNRQNRTTSFGAELKIVL